ncbi:hypothetical protein [Ectobacillus ponti]|uniref:Uncharacterized protein n=1 Tax=Ectobacillus ponti TaxID=2961894 RepID=A0AA41X7X2_9BACI|nr:hypothetical protein [Ectobacillus ponti]MCP8968314.1 hypothetical protein [Ectobacillus ponti]
MEGFMLANGIFFVILKVLFWLLMLAAAVALLRFWGRLSDWVTDRLLCKMSKPMQMITLVATTVSLELLAVFGVSSLLHMSFPDALFMSSLLLIVLVWCVPFFLNHQSRINQVDDRYFGLTETLTSDVYRFRRNAFTIGTLLLAVPSILLSLVYYLPYFLH